MSDLITLARDILAVCQPATGLRATGSLVMTAADVDVNVPVASYLLPIINGQVVPNMPFKLGVGPNPDRSWTITSAGTIVSAMSNLGGARQNIADGTMFVLDPPIDGVDSIVADGDFSGGENPVGLTALKDACMWESMEGSISDNLHKAGVSGFPAAILAWAQSEPADGASDGQSAGSRTSRTSMTYRETFSLSILSSKSQSSHHRRQEGLAIMSQLCELMQDRHAVDGRPFSNPRGIQIIRRYRETGVSKFYKNLYMYTILIGVQHSIEQRDARTWNDWLVSNIDMLTMQRPPLPNQGDHTTVDDMQVEMS